ncbi:MAG: ligase-associated DNA damage response endonuclease PdeM [Paracoccaceae bacterium]
MNDCPIALNGNTLICLPSGALWWPGQKLLCVSDLHLGKSDRVARRGGTHLPPYDTRDTLDRLTQALDVHNPKHVICLGDSFDDLDAALNLSVADRNQIARMQAGRRWIWIEGNHDPGPIDLGGTHVSELSIEGLTFRHIAQPHARGEISGHYHPKAHIKTRAKTITRACFLCDASRLIMPAFGTFTGGLSTQDPVFQTLMGRDAQAILTGQKALAFPMPRAAIHPV